MLSAIAALNGSAQAPQPGVSEFELTAVKYNFAPNVIRVKKGDRVKLVITAEDASMDSSSQRSTSTRGYRRAKQ